MEHPSTVTIDTYDMNQRPIHLDNRVGGFGFLLIGAKRGSSPGFALLFRKQDSQPGLSNKKHSVRAQLKMRPRNYTINGQLTWKKN